MHLLPIELAEYVLNKCVIQDEPKRQISIDGGDFVDKPTVTAHKQVHYNFDILEDKNQHHGNHILDWMVSQEIKFTCTMIHAFRDVT